MCKASEWSAVLNKELQRQVNSLRVFCHHEDRGCRWQGELRDFHHHVQSCPMRDAPLMTELLKPTGYDTFLQHALYTSRGWEVKGENISLYLVTWFSVAYNYVQSTCE